jgi:predicted phage terminase large subunit-like protein
MTVAELEALSSVVADELARRRLLDFAQLVYPKFEAPPHIRFIAELLERIEAGTLRNLCVSVPVRHGKSVLCSQVFPAWHMGRHPTDAIILASHSESLAVVNSRAAKHLVEDDRWPFLDVRMSSDSSSVGRWNVTQGGGVYAVGVGGSITGRGANLLIIDDPLHDALSESERESAWRWFREVAVPRLEPGGSIIVVGARFAGDDVVGRIQDSESASEWTFVRLPALAEAGDPLGRRMGEALWPQRVSLQEVERRRALMSSNAFEAQFQQNPLPSGGLIFKKEWFERRAYCAPDNLWKVMAIDSAWKTGLHNDYSAICTWGTDWKDYYLLDVWHGRVEFPDLRETVTKKYTELRPNLVLCEEAASGYALLQELRRYTGIPIKGLTPRGAKEARAEATTPLFESGKVVLPGQNSAFLDAWLSEHLRFPGAGGHDDFVDTTSLALAYLHQRVTARLAETRWRQQNAELLSGAWMAR